MKYLFLIAVLAFVLAISGWSIPAAAQAGAQSASQSAAGPAIPVDQGNDLENSRKARKLLDQALQALGGQAYLNVHDIQQEGRTYSFYHGQPTSNGVLFWRFVE